MDLIVHLTRLNKFSFNALLGAVESLPFFDELHIKLPSDSDGFLALVQESAHSQSGPTVACFSFFSTQLPDVAALLTQARALAAGRVLFVAGGPHPSGDPRGTLHLGFDLVVCGEGEETFPALLRCLHEGRDYRSLRGLAYLDVAGGYHCTGRCRPVCLDDSPPYSEQLSRFGPIEITRGCPFACCYCQTPQLHGTQIRHRSPAAILDCVRTLAQRGLTDIRFITPNAFAYGSPDGRKVNYAALRDLLAGVRQVLAGQGRIFFGSFPSEVRPEHVTPETVALVREFANNDNLVFGAQSGSPRMLEKCRRSHSLADVYRAAKLTLATGLHAYIDFILGLPGEEEEDVRQSLAMMEELAAMGAQVHAHTFMPLPMTAFARQPAGTVTPEVKRALEMLIARGRAFGDWQKQQAQAEMIAAYLQTQQVMGSASAPASVPESYR